MNHIFLGISFPSPRSYERVRVENVNFNESCSVLKEKFYEISDNKDDVSLVYCGNILEDDEPINRYLRAGSTIHVLRKAAVEDEVKTYKPYNELDVSKICALFRSLNSGNFHVRQWMLLLLYPTMTNEFFLFSL
jgi:hypothetical protein